MNYLAHLALAGGQDPALLAGGLLGDFVKGRLRGARPAALERGIRLHRHIDARSNLDPDLRASAARLVGVPRRYAPPLVDVLADHILAIHFERWHDEPLHSFVTRTQQRLGQWQGHFPAPAAQFYARLLEHDILGAYARPDVIVRISARLGERLGVEGLGVHMEHALNTCLPELCDDFARYYPRLRVAAATWLADTPI